MAIVVQKFGGTSVADVGRIRRCAARAVAARSEGHDVVVVVSAMGHTTDELIDLARQVAPEPSRRTMDLLLSTGETKSAALMAMAVESMGVEAVSLAAPGLGILTDTVHGNARIRAIDAGRLRGELGRGRLVIAAGFQGVSDDGEITTLGRGGSDTSAVAIAAALGVRLGSGICEIYTDVDGVYTADPRLVPGARKIDRISYEEMVELASLGAGILHTRAGLFAQRFEVPLHVRHSQRPEEGTMIVKESSDMERMAVVGCALTPDLGRVSIRGMPSRPGVQAIVFDRIAEANVLVDDIIQNQSGGAADIAFTVEAGRLSDVKIAVQRAIEDLGAGELAVEVGLAKVSAVGVGMRTHTGVAATMFASLGAAGINIANITTSEIKISCIVPKEHGARALAVVHEAFGLGESAVAGMPKARATEPVQG